MGSDYRKLKTRDGNCFIHLRPEGAIEGFEQRDDMVDAVLKEEQSSSSVCKLYYKVQKQGDQQGVYHNNRGEVR